MRERALLVGAELTIESGPTRDHVSLRFDAAPGRGASRSDRPSI